MMLFGNARRPTRGLGKSSSSSSADFDTPGSTAKKNHPVLREEGKRRMRKRREKFTTEDGSDERGTTVGITERTRERVGILQERYRFEEDGGDAERREKKFEKKRRQLCIRLFFKSPRPFFIFIVFFAGKFSSRRTRLR